MRLGLLGPVPPKATSEHAQAVEKAAGFLLKSQKVTRAIYLGPDDALEKVVERWARRLVGDDPTDEAAWRRARVIRSVLVTEHVYDDAFLLAAVAESGV